MKCDVCERVLGDSESPYYYEGKFLHTNCIKAIIACDACHRRLGDPKPGDTLAFGDDELGTIIKNPQDRK